MSHPRDKGDEFPWMSKAPAPIAPNNPKIRPDAPPPPRPARASVPGMPLLDDDGCLNDTVLQEFKPFGSGLRGAGYVKEQPKPPKTYLIPLR
jgi:hypothetical protein